MKDYDIKQIRNLALLGHGSAGKTTLVEAILFNAGAISRLGRVEDGNTTSDYDPEEIKRGISVSLSLLSVVWGDYKINLLDTPGYADFVGEVKSAVGVADCAIVVVCAASGVEVGTEQVWKYADERSLPRLIFVNKMDRENADFYQVFEQIQSFFGPKCIPLQLPIGAQDSFDGVVDLVRTKAYRGTKSEEAEVPAEMQDQVETFREKLLEAAAETDDELLTKYLEGEGLSEAEIVTALRQAVAEGQLVPILVGSAVTNKAVVSLLDTIVGYAPSPAELGKVKATNQATQKEEELDPSPGGPLVAQVFKTTADPYVGRLTYLRVFSGTLRSDSHVWNASKGRDERLGQLMLVRGKTQEPVPQLMAGDMGAVAKLAETTTGDTLSSKERPLLMPAIRFPEPVYSAAVYPKSKADLDKLGTALSRLVEEDPTLRTHRDPDTAETILSGLGDSHLDVALERMRRKFGVEVEAAVPKVPYKETITVPVKSEYKHKKQTGGHGQYGHVFLELTPLPRGSGYQFSESVVGGVVPKNYIPAVEKGVAEALQEGVLAGYPVVDVKVNLYDGSYHSVDSSDMSFKLAGSHAFRRGMSQAQPVLLEPIVSVKVVVPESYMGDVIGDLNSKRAKVLGMNPRDGLSEIEAQAPLAEMLRYATDLRSLTQGRGTFSMEFSHYEEVPAHIAQQVIAAAKKGREEK
jgi:elongation factor G